jgi:hypothetical protein
MKNKKLLLIIAIIASSTGSILKINHIKIFGDAFLILGSVLFIYVLIYFVKNRKIH